MLKLMLEQALKASRAFGASGLIINNHTQDGEAIRKQIDALGRVFRFVDIQDIPGEAAKAERKPWCVISFDDGKKINVQAAEVLHRSGVPACFFVCTEFIGNSQPLWFDDLETLRRHEPAVIRRHGLEDAKKLPFGILRTRLNQAKAELGVQAPLSDPTVAPMSWDDVRALSERGFTFGAHGLSHAILTNESAEDADSEVHDSIATLGKQLGRPCLSFAFPNGNFTPRLIEVAQSAGAQFIVTTEPVWVPRGRAMPAPLPRIQLHPKQGPEQMLLKLLAARPGLVLRDPNGTGRQYISRQRRPFH